MTNITQRYRHTLGLLSLSALLTFGALPALADGPVKEQRNQSRVEASYDARGDQGTNSYQEKQRDERRREEARRDDRRRGRDRDRDYDRDRGRDRDRRWDRDRDRWSRHDRRHGDRRYYRDPHHFTRPWHDFNVRNGLYFRLGRFAGWNFEIPRRLVVDRYDEFYWGTVDHRGLNYDVYLFPVYYPDRVEYVPYAYRNGRLYGRGRLLDHGGSVRLGGDGIRIELNF